MLGKSNGKLALNIKNSNILSHIKNILLILEITIRK